MAIKENIVCRFAPSPTGPLHVGGVRSALFNYLYARQNGGKLVLRIEDTDKERSKKEYEDDIIKGFEWLGLEFDETHRQSDRVEIHQKYLKQLIDSGKAYVSKEESTEEGKRSEVIRFKNPNRKVVFDDVIKGRIEFDTTELKDFVIAKSLTEPLFHLAVVVDDFLMGITHVIRGEDHISNTPRQILIQEAIGAPTPVYGHIPLILSTDRSKLSKRKHGESVSLKFYREQGYLPEALINFLALLGWNPGDDREVFSKEELVKEFRLDKVQKGGAIFNVEKLNWLNKQYLNTDRNELIANIAREIPKSSGFTSLSPSQIGNLSGIIADRISYFGEIPSVIREFEYIAALPTYEKNQLLWKKEPDVGKTETHLISLIKIVEVLPGEPDLKSVQEAINPYAEKNGKGNVLWPLRFALSGKERSMDPFNLVVILGKTESVRRLNLALNLLK